MTGTDLCVNKPQSVLVIFEPPSNFIVYNKDRLHNNKVDPISLTVSTYLKYTVASFRTNGFQLN
jgi:hypothetical protein